MDRDIGQIARLQALILAELGAPATGGLNAALDQLRTSTNLPAAMADYRAELGAVAGSDQALRDAFERVAARPISFLGPLRDAIGPLLRRARELGIDLDAGVRLGPAGVSVTAPVATVRPDSSQTVDRARSALAHLPADGFSTALELGPVNASGGGYLDAARRAAGAKLRANLGFAEVDLALLLDAGTGDGIAVLGLLRAEFRPTGVQLGFGFSLDAVGGIVGVNRDANGERMRNRIADGSALNALFGGGASKPEQIRATLDALADMFPTRPGTHVLGPTLRLGWLNIAGGSLARLDVGLILVIPSGRVLLPGRIVVEVPAPGVPLLHLRLDVLGELDVPGKRLGLDAALVDSRVMGTFTISGTAAVRFAWGEPAVLLATAGGFYPGYRHEPVAVPPQQPLAVTFANPIPVGLSIHLQGYVATAAGTLQAGASATIAFEVLGTGLSGTAGFDAIVQVSPLWFQARVYGRVALKALGARLAGVDLSGVLTGPGPLTLTAAAYGEIMGIEVGGSKDFVLSRGAAADRQPFDGLPDVVRRLLTDGANVSAEGGADAAVVLAPRGPDPGVPLLAPGASLVWAQNSMPLGDPVTKADGRILRRLSTVAVSTAGTQHAVSRRLTTAAFTNLTTAEAIRLPPFDQVTAGWRLEPSRSQSLVSHAIDTGHRTVYLPVVTPGDRRWRMILGKALSPSVNAAVRALDRPAAGAKGVEPTVGVQPETWLVTTPSSVEPYGSAASAAAHAAVLPGARPQPAVAAEAVSLP